jgi:hypothetical protein
MSDRPLAWLAAFYAEDAVNHQVAESPVRGYWDKLSCLRAHGPPLPDMGSGAEKWA